MWPEADDAELREMIVTVRVEAAKAGIPRRLERMRAADFLYHVEIEVAERALECAGEERAEYAALLDALSLLRQAGGRCPECGLWHCPGCFGHANG
jgi:hypothetical protein